MKAIAAAIAMALLAVGNMHGQQVPRTVTLAWDANPAADNVSKYTLYEQTGSTWTVVGETAEITIVVPNVSPGSHTYAVTASNAGGESPRSASAVLPGAPGQPQGLRVISTVTVFVQP